MSASCRPSLAISQVGEEDSCDLPTLTEKAVRLLTLAYPTNLLWL